MQIVFDTNPQDDTFSGFPVSLAIVKSAYRAKQAAKEDSSPEVTANLSACRIADIICRICLESETASNKFISPCNCTGSVQYVHEECLKTWIVSQADDVGISKCELCNIPFKMKFEISTYCSVKQALTEGLSQCLFIPMMLIVLFMLCLVLFLIIDMFVRKDRLKDEGGYLVSLFVTCLISACVIVYLILNALKESCFVERLKEWRILSRTITNTQDCTHEGTTSNFSILSESEPAVLESPNVPRPEQPPVIVIPAKIKINGKMLNTPALDPNLQPLTKREGRTTVYATPALHSSITARMMMTQRVSNSTSRVDITGRSAASDIRA